MKWIPVVVWPILSVGAKRWGMLWLGLSIVLSLALLPMTIRQFQALFGFGTRPMRLDYLVFLWAFVPWWYRRDGPMGRVPTRHLGRLDRAPSRVSSGRWCRADLRSGEWHRRRCRPRVGVRRRAMRSSAPTPNRATAQPQRGPRSLGHRRRRP